MFAFWLSVGVFGIGVGLQHKNILNKNGCYWESCKLQHWHLFFMQMLVWWCLDKLDLDEIVRLHSGHVKGVDIFFWYFWKREGRVPSPCNLHRKQTFLRSHLLWLFGAFCTMFVHCWHPCARKPKLISCVYLNLYIYIYIYIYVLYKTTLVKLLSTSVIGSAI